MEIGEPKNSNKKPVAERAAQELRIELERRVPEGQPINTGLGSCHHRWPNPTLCPIRSLDAVPADQFTDQQLPFSDDALISKQHELRETNHLPSASSKAPRAPFAPVPDLAPGTLVYVHSDCPRSNGWRLKTPSG